MTPSEILFDCINNVISNVHTAMPGIIVEYDHTTSSAKVQPVLNKNYTSGEMPLPILEKVPVMFASGGSNFNITFPINIGDYVLLIFCERSIDLWKSVGGQVTPTDPRKFNLSDAIAIPGLQPFTGNFSNNNNEDFVISFAGSEVRIKANGNVIVKTSAKLAIGSTATEILDLLSALIGYLSGPNVTGPSLGGPLNPTFTALIAPLKAELDLLKTGIT